jgi:hypothetical protein
MHTYVSSVCPIMFKMIANFGSNATSVVEAGGSACDFLTSISTLLLVLTHFCFHGSPFVENCALNYFWWFMVLAAFSGTSLSTAVLNGFNEGIRIGSEIQEAIEATAASIPSQVSATWLNWMIVRFLIILPTQYLLQLNTFILTFLGLKCCARAARGGGKL